MRCYWKRDDKWHKGNMTSMNAARSVYFSSTDSKVNVVLHRVEVVFDHRRIWVTGSVEVDSKRNLFKLETVTAVIDKRYARD